MTQNVSGWLPNLLGPVALREDGASVTPRPTIEFQGFTYTDDAAGQRTVLAIPSAQAGASGLVQLAGDLAGTGSAAATPRVGSLTGVAGVLTRTATTTLDNGEAKTTGRDIIPASLSTPSNAITDLWTFATTAARVYVLRGIVTAQSSTGGAYAAYSVEAFFDNQAGTLTQRVGTPVTQVAASGATAVTVDASAGSIRVRVTGLAGTTLRWTGRLYLHESQF